MKGFTLIELAIVIVIAALLAAVAVPIYNGIVKDSKWTEGKTAVGAISEALDTYSAKTGGDLLTGLSGGAGVAFAPTDADLDEIRMEVASLTTLQYFDRADFEITITDADPDTYSIELDATGGAGGASTNGPASGTVTFDSSTGDWTENY